ncbi:MAG: ribulose-phosphate 3-epimerase [Nitrolancea sp.]
MPETSDRARPLLSPSILTADLGGLTDEIRRAESAGVDYIHLDVMDGRFVPNISIGLPIIEAVRRATSLPLDVHLMIVEPERYIPQFANAGADILTVHLEACPHVHRTLQQIRESGCQAGLAFNPGTPIDALEYLTEVVDLVLVMSVNPGFGGQAFIPAVLSKLKRARALLDAAGSTAMLEIDGGIKPEIASRVWEAGADVLVAGSAIFRPDISVAEAVDQFRAEFAN